MTSRAEPCQHSLSHTAWLQCVTAAQTKANSLDQKPNWNSTLAVESICSSTDKLLGFQKLLCINQPVIKCLLSLTLTCIYCKSCTIHSQRCTKCISLTLHRDYSFKATYHISSGSLQTCLFSVLLLSHSWGPILNDNFHLNQLLVEIVTIPSLQISRQGRHFELLP